MRSDDRHLSGSTPLDTPPVSRRAPSPVLEFLSRCVFLLGYAIVVVVLLAGFLELVSRIICSIHPLTRQAQADNQQASPVYAGAEWAPEFWREEVLRQRKTRAYVPFRLWGVTEWHSRYLNNDSGPEGLVRRTINPTNCASTDAITIWMFGGSTMYGVGVPDWATIPSYLSGDLNAGAQHCVMVSNFGVEGYVTDQELIWLEEQLKAGGHPDIVIFYDGLNDSMAQCPPGLPTPHGAYLTIKSRVEGTFSARVDFLHKSYAVRLAGELLSRFHHPRSVALQDPEVQPRIMSVMSKYQGNMRLVRALADAYGFKLYSFWQPLLIYGHKPLVPFEQHLAKADASKIPADNACLLMMEATYAEAERRSSRDGKFVFLGGVFDSTKEPAYIDQGHLGPRGNEVVAQAIANYVRDHSGQPIQKN
ncbi:MAG TPA: SGNH/GDSL hydrolase family protein [Candidatus Sulfotelmatobacter sp.]